jgi:hypothetical protein
MGDTVKSFVLAAAALTVIATPAFAQEQCQSYVGQTVTLNTFSAVAAILKKLPTAKDEYETTADFEARVATARGSMPETVILPGTFNSKYLNYDADAGVLKVQAYALRNINTDYSRVFGYGTSYYDKVKYSTIGNRDAVLFEVQRTTGSYFATNAFGAKVTVRKIARLTHAIFEGEQGSYDEDLFLNQTPGVDAVIGTVRMTIPEAQSLKASGKVAFVVKPKWPYYAEGVHHWEPKIDAPTDVDNLVQVIVGDIQCGLLLTSIDKVVAALPTR